MYNLSYRIRNIEPYRVLVLPRFVNCCPQPIRIARLSVRDHRRGGFPERTIQTACRLVDEVYSMLVCGLEDYMGGRMHVSLQVVVCRCSFCNSGTSFRVLRTGNVAEDVASSHLAAFVKRNLCRCSTRLNKPINRFHTRDQRSICPMKTRSQRISAGRVLVPQAIFIYHRTHPPVPPECFALTHEITSSFRDSPSD